MSKLNKKREIKKRLDEKQRKQHDTELLETQPTLKLPLEGWTVKKRTITPSQIKYTKYQKKIAQRDEYTPRSPYVPKKQRTNMRTMEDVAPQVSLSDLPTTTANPIRRAKPTPKTSHLPKHKASNTSEPIPNIPKPKPDWSAPMAIKSPRSRPLTNLPSTVVSLNPVAPKPTPVAPKPTPVAPQPTPLPRFVNLSFEKGPVPRGKAKRKRMLMNSDSESDDEWQED